MAGGNNVARMSPRQRMINLMYIVLTAMLALNVSSDVLNGFSQVQEGIDRTNLNMSARNKVQFEFLEGLYRENPTKAGNAYSRGLEIHGLSDSLYNAIEARRKSLFLKTRSRKCRRSDRKSHRQRLSEEIRSQSINEITAAAPCLDQGSP